MFRVFRFVGLFGFFSILRVPGVFRVSRILEGFQGCEGF